MSAFALYLLTESQTNFYLLTEDFRKQHAYLFTENFKGVYVISEEFKKKNRSLFLLKFISRRRNGNVFSSSYILCRKTIDFELFIESFQMCF